MLMLGVDRNAQRMVAKYADSLKKLQVLKKAKKVLFPSMTNA
jgi:hypothetical protein